VAGAILASTRGSDLIVRWGGDEIVAVLSDTDESGGRIVAERIRRSVRRLSDARGVRFDISIGIAVYPTHGEAVDQLLRLADRALYIAKKSGDRLHIGDEHYRLDAQAINVVFQPIVDVWSSHILGYEALGRDPEGRLSVSDLFKKYHVVGQLDELKAICFKEQIRVAQEAGLPRIFLNVDLRVLERSEPIVKPEGMEVILEISEREVLHDVEGYLDVAMRWRTRGYKFAIDDFGEGFVSLPLVARLTPEYIKIDRSLVLQAASSDTFKGFLKHLLQALRMYATEGVIAEGVETDEELAAMKGIGVFIVQGYLTGRPQALLPAPATDAA
jgi:EAL domain-containing protein (putative c-di-GMP-specific phosphodiesterase class I)